MTRLLPPLLAAALVATLACAAPEEAPPSDDGGAGGTGGEGGEGGVENQPPAFAGLERIEGDPVDANSVILRWSAPTDDTTPAEELVATLRVFDDDPRQGDPGRTVHYDVSGRTEYRYSGMPAEDVRWFAVEVRDAEGLAAGGDAILPAVRPTQPPSLEAPVPAAGPPGTTVQIQGRHLLDEPIADDAFTLGGVPVPRASVAQWSNQLLTFTVPPGARSGPLEVRTPFGTATSTAPFQVE